MFRPMRRTVAILAIIALSTTVNQAQDKDKATDATEVAERPSLNQTVLGYAQDFALDTKFGWSFHQHANGQCSSCHVTNGNLSGRYEYLRALGDQGLAVDALVSNSVDNGKNRLPIQVTELDSGTAAFLKLKETGLIVEDVCPKKSHGLQVHDILLKADNLNLKAPVELFAAVEDGSKNVTLTILRKGEKEQVVLSEDQPAQESRKFLVGIVLGELEPVVNAQLDLDDNVRIFVREVRKDSAADGKLKENDILLSIDEKSVLATKDVTQAVQDSNGEQLKFKVRRDADVMTVRVAPRKVEESSHETSEPSFNVINHWNPGGRLVNGVLLDPNVNYGAVLQLYQDQTKATPPSPPSDVDKRLDRIESKLDELKSLLESHR